MKKIFSVLFILIFSLGCTLKSDFKEIHDLKNGEWFSNDQLVFEFEIKDIQASYHFNYLIRNKVSYPFYNLYLQQRLEDMSGNSISSSIDEILLFDPKTGKPYGSGAGDIFDIRAGIPKMKAIKFKNPGKYRWVIQHNMRPDPLKGILSMGAEIIKNN